MKKEELAQILSRDGIVPDLGDIEDHLAVIATDISLPRFEIGMCTARMEEAGPHLRALPARAVQGEELAEEEKMLAFRGLHILGAARDTESFPLLMRLLRRPEDEIDDLLGAAAFLTWEGRIERDKMRGLLTRFYDECQAEDDDLAWYDWQRAIALLGLRDLAPLFECASKEGRISNYLITRSEFEGDLARAEQAPTDIERFKEAHLGYIEDVVESLEWSDRLDEDDLLEEFEEEEPPPRIANFHTPEINPFRHVGRNDPCPCGSGKKAKKCCLAT